MAGVSAGSCASSFNPWLISPKSVENIALNMIAMATVEVM